MEKILLVEPEYKNKFPPLGLMKIATYHRNKGDIVEFYKGQAPYTQIISKDRVYITTLFTFHYDITVKCISHYAKYFNRDSIFIGGVAATLMASDFEKDTRIHNVIQGQLFSSRTLGYEDNVNIEHVLPQNPHADWGFTKKGISESLNVPIPTDPKNPITKTFQNFLRGSVRALGLYRQ